MKYCLLCDYFLIGNLRSMLPPVYQKNNVMVDKDIPFIIIGVILGLLALVITLFLLYYWQKQRKNHHIRKWYKAESNLYITPRNLRNMQTTGVQNLSNSITSEHIYATADSLRRQQPPSNREQATSNESMHSSSQNINSRFSTGSVRQITEVTLENSSLSHLEEHSPSPPPLPARNYGNTDVEVQENNFHFN